MGDTLERCVDHGVSAEAADAITVAAAVVLQQRTPESPGRPETLNAS
jgi:hypothetical protein